MSCRPLPSEDLRRDLIDAWLSAFELRTVRPRSGPSTTTEGGIKTMIVIGADTHKRSHTVAAVEAASGRMLVERTVPAQRRCFEALLTWAREHGSERVWAIEDCRHVFRRAGALPARTRRSGRPRRAQAHRSRAQRRPRT